MKKLILLLLTLFPLTANAQIWNPGSGGGGGGFNINLGEGLTNAAGTANGTPVTSGTPNIYQQTLPNAYTGTEDPVTAAQLTGINECNSSGNMAFGVPNPGATGFPNGSFLIFSNWTNTTCTIEPSPSLSASFTFTGIPVNGSGNIVLNQYGWALCTANVANTSWDCLGLTTAGVVPTNTKYRTLTAVFNGNGSALTAPVYADIGYIPAAGTITGVTLISDQSCSATVDIWVAAAGMVPTVSNTIVASDTPTLSGAQFNSDTTLAGWILSLTQGETAKFKLVTSSTCQRVTLNLQYTTN